MNHQLEYQVLRYQVFTRDNNICQRCKKQPKILDVHHIIPIVNGGTHALDNLISLCPKCHKAVEPSTPKGWKAARTNERIRNV